MDFEAGKEYKLKGIAEHTSSFPQYVPSVVFVREEQLKVGGLWYAFAVVSDKVGNSPFLGRARFCSNNPMGMEGDYVNVHTQIYTRDIWEQVHTPIVSGFLLKIQGLLEQDKLPEDKRGLFKASLERFAKPEFLTGVAVS